MNKTIFDFLDYRQYLAYILPVSGIKRGERAKLSRFLGTQKTVISLVLSSKAHLSLEHAILVSQFLNHSTYEQEYFILLVQYNKSGSKNLENYFYKKLTNLSKSSNIVKSNIQETKEINQEVQNIYFSSWHYSAIHMGLQIPTLQNREQIIKYFNLNSKRVDLILEFLISNGLAKIEKGLIIGLPIRTHLNQGSPELIKHLTNLRLTAIDSLSIENENKMHYSIVMSISEKGVSEIKKVCLKNIKEMEEILRNSKDEHVYTFNLDLFSMSQL